MTKKEYEKPTVKVVQLRHRLILTSGPKTLSGSKDATSEEETWYYLE